MTPSAPDPIRRLPLVALAAMVLTTAVPPAAAALPSPPEDLPGTTERFLEGLETIAQADNLTQARQAHAPLVPIEPTLLPHARDLAGRQGDLVSTLVDELGTALARGNLSDARSLAQAAANTLREDVLPAVERWDRNRTAVATGPVRWADGALRVPVVLLNPPPGGIGAFDVEVTLDATPTEASLAQGQGETRVDPSNRTARLASFDARALTNLDTTRRGALVLGEITLDADGTSPGATVSASTEVNELVDPDGRPVLALSLASTDTVPAETNADLIGTRWLAIGALLAGAAGLVLVVRRMEV